MPTIPIPIFYDGTTNVRIVWDRGAVVNGAFSYVVLWRPAVTEGTFRALLGQETSGGTSTTSYVLINSDAQQNVYYQGASAAISAFEVVPSVWWLIAVTKATGSSAVRLHGYNFTTQAWTRENSTTLIDPTSAHVRLASGLYLSGNQHPAEGTGAAYAIWNRQLSDSELNTMVVDFDAWQATAPTWWSLARGTIPMIDETGGTGNETSRGSGISLDYIETVPINWGEALYGKNLSANPSAETAIDGFIGYGGNSTVTRVNEVAADDGAWLAKSVPLSLSDYGMYQYVTPAPQDAIFRGRGAFRSGGTASGKNMAITIQEYGGGTGNQNGATRNAAMSATWGNNAWSVRKVVQTDRTRMQLYFIGTADNAGDIAYFDDVEIQRLDTDPFSGVIIALDPISYYKMDDLHATVSTDVMGLANPTHSSSVETNIQALTPAAREGNASMRFHNALGDGMTSGGHHKFLGTLPFSMCCWFRLEAFNAGSGHIMVNSLTADEGWSLYSNASTLISFRRRNAANDINLSYTHPSTIVGKNFFACIRYDGANMHLDVNGVADAVSPVANTHSIAAHGADFLIGAYSLGGSGFDGPIDEVAVFDYDIGGTNSTAIYQAGIGDEKQVMYVSRRRSVQR